ncbi:type III toxin-antitoxin system TenpIN family toxin [Rhizobium helianthi]|uniref:Type III toxin-antitoxin system TenpIN family toxin n=1 Tax=Rhizobium helianthi TaxID=1132695 RepID=A0ABW4LYF0_9HYPH
MKIIKIVKLNDDFFNENSGLVEALHTGAGGDVAAEKTRGYGVVMVRLENGMLFGIPLRSHITHRSSFLTKDTKGLDYSKAVLIKDESHVSDEAFHIPQDEFVKIADRELFIRERFEKYIKKYIKAANAGDRNVLREYRFSTLQNYHQELMISDPL